MAKLLDEYVAIAPWDVSTRQTNEGFIRRTIKPALGHLEVRKVRGPILDQLYARLKRREQLEAANTRYEKWATGTSGRREAAGKARAELERRGLAQRAAEQRRPAAEGEPYTMAEWWRQLESDLAAADRAIEREHQAAIAAGKPWPPEHRPQSEPEHVPKPESNLRTAQEADVQSGPDDQAARLDELFAQATEAAERFTKEKADREARAGYAARLEREAYAEPEATLQAEATYEADIEL